MFRIHLSQLEKSNHITFGGDMIAVLTHHWAKIGQVSQARELLNRNGLAQSKAEGFIRRESLYSLKDRTKITSIVTWESIETYDKWRASPERKSIMAGATSLWSQPTKSERFEVPDQDLLKDFSDL